MQNEDFPIRPLCINTLVKLNEYAREHVECVYSQTDMDVYSNYWKANTVIINFRVAIINSTAGSFYYVI